MLDNVPSSIALKSSLISVKFSYRFLQALLAIEHDYEIRSKFRVRASGQGRLVAHLTKSDLQLATALMVGCDSDGAITYTNRHAMYVKMSEWFEDPVSKDQFYASFQKFELLGLLQVTHDRDTGTLSLCLNPYLEDDGRIGRFVLLPPLVFSDAFSRLPVGCQKLYYYACGQQGDQKKKLLQLNYERLGELLHRSEPAHIRRILESLSNPLIKGEPLLTVARTATNVMGGYKAIFQCNAALLPTYEAGQFYRDPFPAKKGLRRLIKRLEGFFLKTGCSSLWNDRAITSLAALLRGKSEAYVYMLMDRARELSLEKRFGQSAEQIIAILRHEMKDRVAGILLAAARKTGVIGYVLPAYLDEFLERMKGVPRRLFLRACQLALPKLEAAYGKLQTRQSSEYQVSGAAVEALSQFVSMDVFTSMAYRMQLSPEHYENLLNEIYKRWLHNQITSDDIGHRLAWEMERLPKWPIIPEPPADFRLAEFLEPYIA